MVGSNLHHIGMCVYTPQSRDIDTRVVFELICANAKKRVFYWIGFLNWKVLVQKKTNMFVRSLILPNKKPPAQKIRNCLFGFVNR